MDKSLASAEIELERTPLRRTDYVLTQKIAEIAGQKVEENRYFWKGDPVISNRKANLDGHKPVTVELFCGLGGMSLGFETAGFQTALGLDIHEPSFHTFGKNHPTAITVLGDIRRVKGGTLSSLLNGVEIDVLMAGVPCQGFSLCNRKRCADDERNYLFLYFVEAIKELQPTYVVLENVSGMKSMNGGSFASDVEEAIRECGYEVEHTPLNAMNFGVPQKRTRLIFIGAKKGFPITWPEKTHGVGGRRYVTVRDALSDLPPLEAGESKKSYLTGPQNDYQRMMRCGVKRLTNHKAPNHPHATIEKIRNTAPGAPMYGRFKQRIRLSWDDLSPTQVSGGIRPQFQFGHPEQARGLTVRERCRLQSIPDRVEVFGGIVQGRVQTGNAVPPLLARAIAQSILVGLRREKGGGVETRVQSLVQH